MIKFIVILFHTVYIVFFLGLVFHTSAHPEILGKYTKKYFIVLATLFLLYLPYLMLLKSKLKMKEKKFFLTRKKKILICLLIIILPLLSTELFFRNKYKNYESHSYIYSIDYFHPFLQLQLTKDYTTKVNSHGFRSEEMSKQKPDGVYRIFVLGGSTVLSRGTSFEKTSSKLLEKLLQQHFPHKKIEVINAGVDGYTSEHSLIQYLFKIKDFAPDMIVMWHGINDWYYSCTPSYWAIKPFTTDYSHYLGADALMVKNYFQPQSLITFKFVTVDFILKFIQENLYSDFLYWHTSNYSKSYYDDLETTRQYEMKNLPSLFSYKRNMQSFIDITKNDQVALILGNQPNLYKEDLSREELRKIYFPAIHCSKDGKYPSISSVIQSLNEFNNATKEIALENKISFIDLDKTMPKNLKYFTDDVHYTDLANEKIASVLYEHILSNGFIEK